MPIMRGKLLTDEQAGQYQDIWDAFSADVYRIPSQNATAKQYRLDTNNDPFKALEKKYFPMLDAILDAAPTASPDDMVTNAKDWLRVLPTGAAANG